jgi:archaellum component FlaC
MAEDIDLKALLEQAKRINSKLEAFRESVDDRFDQQIELIKSSYRILSQEIASLRESVGVRFESIDARFEQQLEMLKSGFKTLSQEIATLKKS